MMKYIPMTSDVDAPELADLVADTILKNFNTSTFLITDHRAVFTSNFWSSFCYCFHIKQKLSTAFHSQTDSQTE